MSSAINWANLASRLLDFLLWMHVLIRQPTSDHVVFKLCMVVLLPVHPARTVLGCTFGCTCLLQHAVLYKLFVAVIYS